MYASAYIKLLNTSTKGLNNLFKIAFKPVKKHLYAFVNDFKYYHVKLIKHIYGLYGDIINREFT